MPFRITSLEAENADFVVAAITELATYHFAR
jgi:hypothetical protein